MITREKVSVSLTHELLKAISENKGVHNRSAFIELAVRDYLIVTKGVNVPLPKEE